MVKAIHVLSTRAHGPRQNAARFDIDGVRVRPLVLPRLPLLVPGGLVPEKPQILVQRPSTGNGQGLDAAADPKDRDVRGQRRACQRKLRGVAIRIDLDPGIRLDGLAELFRIDVHSTAEEETVEVAEDLLGICSGKHLRLEPDRFPARRLDRGGVRTV
jgi:hypothetical protein